MYATRSLVVIEFKLQRFIVRDPEKSLGVFAGTWWDLTDEQREAAAVLGYQNDPDVVSSVVLDEFGCHMVQAQASQRKGV